MSFLNINKKYQYLKSCHRLFITNNSSRNVIKGNYFFLSFKDVQNKSFCLAKKIQKTPLCSAFLRFRYIPKLTNLFTNNLLKKQTSYNRQSHKNVKLLYPLFGITIFGYKITDELIEEQEKGVPEDEPVLITMIRRGILAMRLGEFDKSEQLFHIALKTAQEQEDEQAITYIYDMMANLAYQQEYFNKAEKLFKKTMERLINSGTKQDDNSIVEISLKLASIFAATDRIEDAITGFHYCIACLDTKIKKQGIENLDEDSLLLWGMSMDWFARFLIRLGEYELAKKHFIKAYEMCERVRGPLHDQVAVILNDIGSVCSLMDDYNEAFNYLSKAIDLAKKLESPDLPTYYINLGCLQMEHKLLDDAAKNCQRAAALATIANNQEFLDEGLKCLSQIKKMQA